jgi:membrane protease YdiL (CAAX protease family)
VLGEQPKWQVVVLAAASSLAEEIFFRGALQPHLGIWLTAAVFGIVHYPFHEKLIAWPVFAFAAGLLLGYECRWTGSLLAPVLTHFVINLCNLWRITNRYRNYPAELLTA